MDDVPGGAKGKVGRWCRLLFTHKVKRRLAAAVYLSSKETSKSKGGKGQNGPLHEARRELLGWGDQPDVSRHLSGKESSVTFRHDCVTAAALLKEDIDRRVAAAKNPKRAKARSDYYKARRDQKRRDIKNREDDLTDYQGR